MKTKQIKFYTLVILFLLAFVSLFAQNPQKDVREGNNLYKDKKYNLAELEYKRSIEKKPDNFEGNYNLGNAYYRQGKYDEASKQFIQSTGVNNDKANQAKSYYNMGNAQYKAEKYQESVDAYKMALRLNPNDDDARYNLSSALLKLKQQQNENKDDKKKDGKDNKDQQKKDQQQQEQQKKDQQKKDQQNQQKQEQQDQAKKEQEKKEQQARQPKISKEDAERMLKALKNDEKNLQKKLAKRFEASGGTPEKDW